MAAVSGTSSDDFFVPSVNGADYRGGKGNDTYIITAAIPSNAIVTITDKEGMDRIQLTDGLTISSGTFFANAVELTLSNGSKVRVLEATHFHFEVGANATSGDTATSLEYSNFAELLGVPSLPVTGSVTQTLNFHVPVGHGIQGITDVLTEVIPKTDFELQQDSMPILSLTGIQEATFQSSAMEVT